MLLKPSVPYPLHNWKADKVVHLLVLLVDSGTEFPDLFPDHVGRLVIQGLAYNIANDVVPAYTESMEIVYHVGIMEAALAHAVLRMVDIANRQLHAIVTIDNTKAVEFLNSVKPETIFIQPLALVLTLPFFFNKCFIEFKAHIRDGLDSVELLDGTAYGLQGFISEPKEVTHDKAKRAMITSVPFLTAINAELKDDVGHIKKSVIAGLAEYKTNVRLLVSTFNTQFEALMKPIENK